MNAIWAIWDGLSLPNVQAILSILQALGSLGVFVSIFTYVHQRRTTLRAEERQRAATAVAEERQRASIRSSEQQANRSRLTEAYMSVHAHILRMNSPTINLVEQMIKRGEGYVDLTRHGEMTAAIEILYMKLNAFFLEWHYRNLYGDMDELDKTFDHAMRGLAKNSDPRFKPFVEHFDKIFADFPDAFRYKIHDRLIAMRDDISPSEAAARRVANHTTWSTSPS